MNNNLPRKVLTYFLLFLCLVLVAFLAWANFSPSSPLNLKKNSAQYPAPSPTETPKHIWEQFKIKINGKERLVTPGQKCSELLKLASDFTKEENKPSAGDINKDGKIDYKDLGQVIFKAEDEQWCEDILNGL